MDRQISSFPLDSANGLVLAVVFYWYSLLATEYEIP